MANDAPMISGDDFFARPLNPLTYYNLLPSDRRVLAQHANLCPAELAAALLADRADQVAAETLDAFLLGCASAPDQFRTVDLARIAAHATEGYARLLQKGKSGRRRRMKLQQLNFFCRDLADISLLP